MNRKVITLILATMFGVVAFYSTQKYRVSAEKQLLAPPVESDSASEVETVETVETERKSATRALLHPQEASQRPVEGTATDPNQNEANRITDQTVRAQFLEQIQPILQVRLLNEGFTQHEIDQTAKELAIEFGKGDEVIKYSEAAYRAAKALNFSEDKKDQLNMAVLQSMAESVEIPYDRWNQCLNHRVRSMSPCVQTIAEDLSRSVAAASSGQSLLGEARSSVLLLSKKAMADAVARCEITEEAADRAMRIVLSDCP